jgi:hypothetical protein
MGDTRDIKPEDLPLLKEEEYSDKICGCGSNLRISKEKRRRNTAYADEECNWLNPCCDACYMEDHNHYADLWAGYYADCM